MLLGGVSFCHHSQHLSCGVNFMFLCPSDLWQRAQRRRNRGLLRGHRLRWNPRAPLQRIGGTRGNTERKQKGKRKNQQESSCPKYPHLVYDHQLVMKLLWMMKGGKVHVWQRWWISTLRTCMGMYWTIYQGVMVIRSRVINNLEESRQHCCGILLLTPSFTHAHTHTHRSASFTILCSRIDKNSSAILDCQCKYHLTYRQMLWGCCASWQLQLLYPSRWISENSWSQCL